MIDFIKHCINTWADRKYLDAMYKNIKRDERSFEWIFLNFNPVGDNTLKTENDEAYASFVANYNVRSIASKESNKLNELLKSIK